ncbi:Hpt domain protein [Pseudobythopirellula maris]|uniref:Hpt domain protein n=1 Tax=Pseudobythopirellula maris TaxID=2527991 RepID=A0A5C5ZWW3_9BACT|nr:Hpt domain-containing protein [Pseudobythopirellula maris]TWT90793.1 Hpt domain protein [Pseudobythopirellula maris]
MSLPAEIPILADPGMRELVDGFVMTFESKSLQLERLLVHQDYPEIKRLSHQIKGAGGSYGFTGLTAPAAQVERLCDSVTDSDESQAAVAVEAAVTVLQEKLLHAAAAWNVSASSA